MIYERLRKQSFIGAYVALAQLDRVFGYEPKGRGFESPMPRQKKALAKASAFFD